MRYFKFTAETPFVGTESVDFFSFAEDEVDEESLNDLACELAHRNAESYEYLETGWGRRL